MKNNRKKLTIFKRQYLKNLMAKIYSFGVDGSRDVHSRILNRIKSEMIWNFLMVRLIRIKKKIIAKHSLCN